MLDNDTLVPIVLFVAIAMMFIAAGHTGDIARMLAASAEDRVGGALKWGIVAVAAGAGRIHRGQRERGEPRKRGELCGGWRVGRR